MQRAFATLAAALALVVSACSSSGPRDPERAEAEARLLDVEVRETIERFQRRDPGLVRFFEEATGYAVIPTVAKGGFVVGGAHGEGQVFEHGVLIGLTEMSQGTVGLQIGGQAYSELIFFKDAEALNAFKRDTFEFSGQASAIAAQAGAAATADYESGVAIFTLPKGGLMLEASVGGQKFEFRPLP